MSSAFRRRLAVGVAVGGLYALVAVVTIRASDTHVRPLFEGVGPHTPYQWVDPPKAFAAGNVKPQANDSPVTMGPNGNVLAGAGSSDGQIVLNLPEGGIPPRPPDDRVMVRIIPVDPEKLAEPPTGLRSNGNAYKVEPKYVPSGQPIEALTKPGNVILTIPEASQGLLFSPDGKTWETLESQDVGGFGTVGGPFSRFGYYMGATSSFTSPPGESGDDSSSIVGVVVVGAITLALAFLLGFGPALMRRLRRRRARSEPAPVRAARTQQSTARRNRSSGGGNAKVSSKAKPKAKPKPRSKGKPQRKRRRGG